MGGLVEPAPSGVDRMASSDQKSIGSKIHRYIYNPDNPGTKTVTPRFDTARHGVKSSIPLWRVFGWLRFVEPAPHGENRVTSPNHKSFHTYIYNFNNRATITVIPRADTAPHTVWNPPLYWLIADWRGFADTAQFSKPITITS